MVIRMFTVLIFMLYCTIWRKYWWSFRYLQFCQKNKSKFS